MPWIHFEFIEYYFCYLTLKAGFVVFDIMRTPLLRMRPPLLLSVREFSKPPVRPTGARNIETSTQLEDSYVEAVHIHLPSMQAPFLLQ